MKAKLFPIELCDIVQLSPTSTRNPMFAGCFMIITEPKPWGAQGYVQALGEDGEPGGQAYYRATWDEMYPIGAKAEWVVGLESVVSDGD